MIKARTVASLAALAVAALALVGCSGGSPSPGDTGSEGELSAAAQAALDKAYEGVGSKLDDLPSVTVTPGESFYVMSCGEQLSTCHAPAEAMVEAAEAAGWTGNIVDGKLNAGGTGFADAIRQAIAAGADVISPVGIGCSAAAAAFQEAKAAGITVVGGGGVDDCDPKVWDSERLWLPADVAEAQGGDPFHSMGTIAADYAFGKTNGDVHAVIINATTNAWGPWLTEGFENEVKTLGGDDSDFLDVIDVTDPETADNSYLQKVTTSLLNHPDVNVLYVPTDSYLVNGLAAAVAQAGFADKVLVISNFGSEAALDMIRQGQPGINAVVGFAQNWGAWGSIDTAIRIQAGQDPVYIGEQQVIVDKDHNLPASGAFEGTIDYKAAFKKSWGVG